jgi:hypothetical protein
MLQKGIIRLKEEFPTAWGSPIAIDGKMVASIQFIQKQIIVIR